MLTEDQMGRYDRDGFVVVDGLFDEEETNLLLQIASADDALGGPRTGSRMST